MTKFISISALLASFLFGLFFIYMWGDEQHPVYLYPNPENVYSVVYKDKAGSCYVYKPILTECTDDSITKIQE